MKGLSKSIGPALFAAGLSPLLAGDVALASAEPVALPSASYLWLWGMVGFGVICLLGVIGTLHRIRRIGTSFRDRNLLLQMLIDSISSPIFYKSREGVYLGGNEAFYRMLGRTAEEVVGRTVFEVAPPELAEIYYKADQELYESGGTQRYETRVRFADNEVRDVLFTKSLFHDGAGKVAGLIGVMVDISRRKKAELDLQQAYGLLEARVEERTRELARAESEARQQRDYLHLIIESLGHGLLVINARDYRILLANSSARKYGDPLGKRCHEVAHGSSVPCATEGHTCPLDEVVRTGKPVVVEHIHELPVSGTQYVEVHAHPVFDDNGEVSAIIENCLDITERKQAEMAMVEARDMAERTSSLMSEFLTTVSHELRTPLTSVQGFAKLIARNFDTHFMPLCVGEAELTRRALRIRENLNIILSEGDRLIHLVNENLDLSRLESGRAIWSMEKSRPAEMAERAVMSMRVLLDDSGLEFSVEAASDLPDIECDPDRIHQVLVNLLSNAVKFTPRGSVRIEVAAVEEGVRFSVRDTGPGIPEAEYENVFSKFGQLGNKLTEKPQGTGLGLPICREIVRRHGGFIWVESEVGKGSEFVFVLPLVPPERLQEQD